MKANYEEVWETLEEYGIIDENNVHDDRSLLKEIEKNDKMGKIPYALFYELLETKKYREVVERNLQVNEYKKKDVVQDGEKYVIPKTKQVTYFRRGRKIQYYLAAKRRWKENEISWIQENRSLPTKLMLYKFYQNFGEVRTVSSVMTKRRNLGGTRQHMTVKKSNSAGKKRILDHRGNETEDANED